MKITRISTGFFQECILHFEVAVAAFEFAQPGAFG